MNMFKSSGVSSIDEYLESLEDSKKEVINQLDKLIKDTVPNLKPFFANNMLGYGEFEYINYKKELASWPIIALASQKNYFSLYVCAVDVGEYVAEKFKDDLGDVSVGKSCIRFKKLDDLNIETIKKILKIAEESPGLVTSGEHKNK